MINNYQLKKVKAKSQNYNTEFRLYPKSEKEPVFVIEPLEKFEQYTWVSTFSGSNYTFTKIKPTTPIISMVEGTDFSIDCSVIDPSNVLNQLYDKNIRYTWRKDGSPLYEYNVQNGGKGTKQIKISSTQCRRDLSGTYQLEARNKYGSTFSEPFEIDVINKKYHPMLYSNLIVNPNGAKGLEGWVGDSDFKVQEFSLDNRTQWSIPGEVYKPYTTPYVEQFNFSLYPNEDRLSLWFDKMGSGAGGPFDSGSNSLASYNRWHVANYHPNLVDGDRPGWGSWASFFPSWDYLDEANNNTSQLPLGEIVTRPKTYFTRDKLKFTSFGGKPKCLAYQDIDVTDASSMIDGNTYGINKVVLHFFAYVGVGISKYSFKYRDRLDYPYDDNTIPITYPIYISGAYAPEETKPTLIPLYNWAAPSENCFCCPEKGLEGPFVFVKENLPINITPVADDVTDIKIEFFDENENLIDSTLIKGPDERDIWSVKEKFFVPYYLGNLYSWMLDSTDEEFKIFNQRYTTMDAIRGIDIPSADYKDINAEWMQAYHYPLYSRADSEYKRVNKYDRGAAAMFGITEDIVLPRGTRKIRVSIVFNHKSNTLFDSNPRLKKWEDQTIYYDYYTNTQTSDRLLEYGNPRCGVTAMHLSLHPDTVEISEAYSTYKIPINTVWYKRRNQLGIHDAFWSVVDKATPVTALKYLDIKPDGFFVFANNNLPGPTSVYNVGQQQAALGLGIGNLQPLPPPPLEIPNIDFASVSVNNADYFLSLTGNDEWKYYQWQVDLIQYGGIDGTYYNIAGATGKTLGVDNTPSNMANRYRISVSQDDVRYYYSEPFQFPTP